MTADQIVSEISRYVSDLSAILSRFNHTHNSVHITAADEPTLRQYVRELMDLFDDTLGKNSYSAEIASEFNSGISNIYSSPSFTSVSNILAIVRAVQTRLSRNPELLRRKEAEDEFQSAAAAYEQTGIAFPAGSAKWEEVASRYNVARDRYDFLLRSTAIPPKSPAQVTNKKGHPARYKTAFAEYAAGRLIGEGGTGRVFEAADEDGRKVAVKCLRPGSLTTDRSKRFKNEISFCRRNIHPNIVTALDWGLSDSEGEQVPFYVMPLYPTTLRKIMSTGIEQSRVVPLVEQILAGIDAAHQAGVWHRDLKPENILYDPDADEIVIADFGIAHFAEPLLQTLIETGAQQRLANFQYAAPEQRTKKPVDGAADVYALGLILNEMFTGELLQGTQHALIGSVASQFAHLDDIVDRMVRQSPAARPSIAEVRRALGVSRAAAAVDPTVAPPSNGDPILALPIPDDFDVRISNLKKVGPRVKIQPIVPEKCAVDEFMLVDGGSDVVEFEKMSSGHRISVPKGRIREVLPEDRDWRSATVILDGRIQWISVLRTWRFFPEPLPTQSGLQIGLGKPSSGADQNRAAIESMLQSRGAQVWLVDERQLSSALAEGRQVVYDDDGRYFRVPSGPNQLILIASGP